MSPAIFKRDALKTLYPFFTEGKSNAYLSFIPTSEISAGDYHQLWCEIHAGASAAIKSVRAEFEAALATLKTEDYLYGLSSGEQRTQLMLCIKGTHLPLNYDAVRKRPKGLSLIKIAHLYTKDLQGV